MKKNEQKIKYNLLISGEIHLTTAHTCMKFVQFHIFQPLYIVNGSGFEAHFITMQHQTDTISYFQHIFFCLAKENDVDRTLTVNILI
jgi:hypothetical protein